MTPIPKSDLCDIEKIFLIEIFAFKEQAIPIDVTTIKFEACCLNSKFYDKNESAQISSIRRFIT